MASESGLEKGMGRQLEKLPPHGLNGLDVYSRRRRRASRPTRLLPLRSMAEGSGTVESTVKVSPF